VRTFVDTDVLVHAVDEADARRRGIARELLAAGVDPERALATSSISTTRSSSSRH
jgi:hypothetical protein